MTRATSAVHDQRPHDDSIGDRPVIANASIPETSASTRNQAQGTMMATCDDCDLEMNEAASCVVDEFLIRGERFARTRQVSAPVGPNGRCGDCGIHRRGFHHFGCDMEPCPRCRRQLLSCGCGDHPDDEDIVDIVAVANGVVRYPAGLSGLHVPPGRFPYAEAQDG